MAAQSTGRPISAASMRDDMRKTPPEYQGSLRRLRQEVGTGRRVEKKEERQFSDAARKRRRVREGGRGWSRYDQAKQAIGLAYEDRKAIEDGDFSVFRKAFIFAITKDFIFDILPVVGLIFGFFIAVYLFIFLWGRGKWKVRIVMFFLLWIFDMLPAAKLIPFSTICVFYAYQQAKKRAHQVKEGLAAAGVTV